MADKDSKTEEPTSRRLNESWRKGQFAKAEEIGMVFVMLASFLVIIFMIEGQTAYFANFAKYIFGNLYNGPMTVEEGQEWVITAMRTSFVILAPFFIASILASVIAGGLQSRFKLTLQALKGGLGKLNPVKGFQRIFSLRSLVKTGFDLVKMAAVAVVIWAAWDELTGDPIFYEPVPASHILQFILKITILMFIRLIVILALVAFIHFAYEKWQTHQDLKMTRQEVKDERKQSEGDPLIKRAQRQMAMRLAQKQMLDGVATADVVVTNPTHYAVALKYERGKDVAPIVVAKGENLLARRIKSIARENEVPTVENKMLARVLYKLGRINEPIPAELYQAVADLLAYVYKTYKYYFYRLRTRREALSLGY